MIKSWLALGCWFIALGLEATDQATIEAKGQVFYKMPKGEMVTRDVSLIVPVMGEGKVILQAKGHTILADRYFTLDHNGRLIFYVIFTDFPFKSPGQIAVWRGTYTRGTNLAIYYGDIFLGTDGGSDGDMVEALDNGLDQFRYIAGFHFEAPVLSSFEP